MEYADFLERTGRHLGLIDLELRSSVRPRTSWARMLEAEAAARERAEKFKEKKA